MRIKDISVHLVNALWRNFVIVRVSTDEGIVGYGEGTMGDFEKTIEAAVLDFKPHLIGREIDIPSISRFLYRNFFWRGGPILMTATSAIEQALWDILGKSSGKPVFRLLGGKAVEKVRVYANGFISGQESPEKYASATQSMVEKGFTAVKFDPFGGEGPGITRKSLDEAVSRIKAIRETVGYDVDILIEAHGRFNPVTALKVAKAIEKYEPFWLEEPVPEENIEAMAYVRSRSTVPIATGERIVTKYRYDELIRVNAADIIQPDVCHIGGIKPLTEVASMAEARYINVAPHNPNGPIATAATLNALITMPNALILEFWVDAETVRHDLIQEYFDVRGGYIYPKEKPGLGIEVNETALNKYPYKKLHLEYFSENYKYHGDVTI
jgi:galactonate dehydratase